jgi:hypothetical protein
VNCLPGLWHVAQLIDPSRLRRWSANSRCPIRASACDGAGRGGRPNGADIAFPFGRPIAPAVKHRATAAETTRCAVVANPTRFVHNRFSNAPPINADVLVSARHVDGPFISAFRPLGRLTQHYTQRYRAESASCYRPANVLPSAHRWRQVERHRGMQGCASHDSSA